MEFYVINGGSLDVHTLGSKVLNKIGLSTTGIPGELHVPSYQFLGPNTSLFPDNTNRPNRLNPDRTWKDFSAPINALDHAAYTHDLEYYDIEKNNTDKDTILKLKHEADQRLLTAFDAFQPSNWRERLARFFVQNAIKLKLRFGMSLDKDDKDVIKRITDELHHRYKKGERRMVIVPNINHTHSCDIFEYDKQKFVTYIDVFSKKACIFMIKNKNADTTLKALEGAFLFLGSPRFLWTDDGKEFVNKKVQDYLTEKNVKWYSTFSELKACVIERFNLTIREKLEKSKTEYELSKSKFVLREVLPKILEEYNNTVHSTTKMTPNDAHKPENEMAVRRRYITRYKLKDKGVAIFDVGDKVRIYNYKYIFEKKSGKRFTEEIFKVKKANNTKPVTYTLEDKEGEEVKGSFYNHELVAVKEEL